ncbi:DNA repair protein RAD50 [Teratosphaeria destructans]|uniref:DNA repair protein RAD50 n=1 Tax=Teratosphaeria destructans TaxID=418781 RepID=A0A9W7VYV6_9PEZI|nr:DNA repair protein RAD50 [Teratosphaeria destructans]
MSMIDKLNILGVRSFDNTRSETIAFSKPLTLIVGTNGSGKTTIIECLKYVTTGLLPPNSGSGAFVHDPKLCNEREVMAQIRLSFKNTSGASVVCTRNLQLTVKKNTRQFKTLEGTILLRKDGEKHSMSSRVAEMNTMMPQFLGVSKAVLDNVIFCHQEESLWPLATPADLKKRFDEIFEAMKYTKAIENIKVMSKEYKTQLLVLKKEEEYAHVAKKKGKEMEKRSEKMNAEIEELRKQHDDFADRIKQAGRNAEAAWQKVEAAGAIVGKLEGKRIERRTKEESVQSLRENLVEKDEPDDELERMVSEYEAHVEQFENELKSQKAKYHEFDAEVKQGRSRVVAKERECGAYEAEATRYKSQVQSRDQLVKDTARSLSIRGYDADLTNERVGDFIDRVARMAKDQEAMLERSRRDTSEELQSEQSKLSDYNQNETAERSRKESARQTIAANDRKIDGLQRDSNAISVDEGSKAALDASEKEVVHRLAMHKDTISKANFDEQVRAAEIKLRELEESKEQLDAELVESTKQAGEVAQLDHVQKELKKSEVSLETMSGAHSERIDAMVGQGWTVETLGGDFQRAVAEQASQVAEAERQRDGVSRELDQVDFQHRAAKKDLDTKKESIKHAEAKIKEALEGGEPSDYNEALRKLEADRDELRSATEKFTMLIRYFDECIKCAQVDKTACRTCNRKFGNNTEIQNAVEFMRKERKKAEQQLQNAPSELKETEQELQAVKAAYPDYETWERVKGRELPKAMEKEKELRERRVALNEQLESKDESAKECVRAKKDVEALSDTIQRITNLSIDIADRRRQIDDLMAKQQAGNMLRSPEQIQDESKKVVEEMKAARSTYNRIRDERDKVRAKLNSLELELRDVKAKLSSAEYQLKEKASYDRQIQDLKRMNVEQRETIKACDQKIQEIRPKKDQIQAKYDDIARRGAAKDREQQAELTRLTNCVNKLKLANQEIATYIAKGGDRQIENARREITSLQKEVASKEKEQQKTVSEVKKLEDQLRNQAETKRQITDNQRYRRDLRQLEQVRAEIAELETHNAEEEKRRYEQEGSKWQLQRNKLSAEQATVTGAVKSKDEALGQLLADYDTEYKDSARKYKEAHVKVEATKACVEDLSRYGGALDKAIMRYHSLKMEEINRIIEELWSQTYQGTDVDTILIRSESETAGKNNKSYNYRVCMVKSEAEMDMRGRCSAGQKVLASIIIRLALAEVFGTNCGIIALDEPTTNLDQDNIRALAESLGNIIKARRQQKNFQLIVITHDEEFLRYMGCSDYADTYWRVSRNNAQKSVIERQNIADVL